MEENVPELLRVSVQESRAWDQEFPQATPNQVWDLIRSQGGTNPEIWFLDYLVRRPGAVLSPAVRILRARLLASYLTKTIYCGVQAETTEQGTPGV